MSDEQQASELLPCPFCLGPAQLTSTIGGDAGDGYSWRIGCHEDNECPMMPYIHAESESTAIHWWNLRKSADLAPVAQPPELVEALAALAHEQWSGWMNYVFATCTYKGHRSEGFVLVLPTEYGDRWLRQTSTPYAELPENEKESDRKEAQRMIDVFNTTSPPAASVQPPSPQSEEIAKQIVERSLKEYHICERTLNDLAKDIATGITRSTELRQPQPMSTAPKDGSEVLIFHQNTPDDRLAVDTALYTPRKGMWVSPDGGYAYDPIAWIPKLSPPSETN